MPPTDIVFSKLSERYNVADFDCGHEDTNEFIRVDAPGYQKTDIATTYVVKEADRVIGFVSLAMGAITVGDHPDLVVPGVEIRSYPCLKIGRLGVDQGFTRRGLGTMLLDLSMNIALELKEKVGCRFLTVDAYPHRIRWYRERRGFQAMFSDIGDRDTMPMYVRVSGN